ncbi:hypothetical protein AVEN_258320-1 [Araneus ventricosus]|uniref:Uncharacterized protein n=1 Tax=Araneus ventricosus TaxID=182803 RepID=A0A4Y2HN54_ARAVE|nr:hypothetical protein AVEN_258320-1 [Araneus ventricosus]
MKIQIFQSNVKETDPSLMLGVVFYDAVNGVHSPLWRRRLMVMLWRTVLRHLTLMYISQYPPPDIGNSFCLVVRIFGSEPKGPRFYPAAKVVTRGQRTRDNNFQSH